MGNEQSQQEGSEGMASRVGTGASAGVPPTPPPPPPNDMAPNRTGVEDENVGVAPPPGVDLSNLSEEERKMILSVMARAQDLDNDITQRRRSAELSRAESLPNSVTAHQVVCLACHVTELTNKTSAKCTKCGKTVCEKCGQHPTSADGKKYPWICNACARHHIQANRARAIGQVVKTSQDDVTRSDSAEDDPADKKTQRKDEVPIRRQTRSPAKSRRESVEVVITDDKQQPEVRIRSAQKRSDGIVRAARPVVVVNGEVSAPKNATKLAGVDTGRTEVPVESVQNKKLSQTEVKIKKPPETKPTEAVIKPLLSPKKFEAISSPKSSKKPESASTLQKTEILGTVKKKDISGSPKRSDVVGSPKRAEVASSSPLRTEVITSPKRTEPARSPQKSKSPTSPKVTPSPKRTEMIKPQVNVSVTKVTPTAQTTSQDVPTATSRKANEILTKPAEILTKPTTIGEDKDLVSARIVASPPTTSDIVPISSSPQMTITSPVFDRPIISVDVVIVSKSSASLTTLHDASKSDTTDTMASLNTVTTTTRSKTGGSIRSSVVSITPSESVLTSPSPTKEHKAAILISDESTSSFKDSAHFSLVKKPEECSVSSRQFVSNKMTENWEQSALPQLRESNVDTRDHLTKDQAKPSDSSVSTTEIRSELPSRLEISTVDASVSYQSYQDQSDANYQTKEPNQSKQKPKTIDLQSQKKVKQKVETADWSPVSDLSPIPDVSPSLEAAEQEIMEKFRGRSDSEGSNNLTTSSSAMPRATSGTISGMLADFNKALELLDTSPVEDPQKQDKPVASPTQSPPEVPATCSSLASVTTEPSIYHPVRQQRTQQQPGTPRRTRRLPQPTMEQMQAAVAMAAHGPRDKQSIALTPVSTSLPVTTSQRPVSPIMPWRTIDSYLMSDVDDYDARSLIQPATSLHEDINLAKTVEDATSADAHDRVAIAEQSIVGTERLDGSDRAEEVISSPVGQVDTELPHLSFSTENNGPTDLDIIKLKLRRKLPSVPSPEHGKLPSPNKRAKDRTRTLSTGATPLFTQEWGNGDSVEEPITTSADDSSSIRLNSQKRSASADGDYVLNLSPTRLNVSYSPETAGHGGLGSRKELSVSQGNLPYLRTPSPLLGSDSKQLVGAGTQLPAYMKTLKQQLREELKAVTEERKRVQEVRSKERDYYMSPEKESNYVSQQWQETDASLQYDNLSHRSLLHSTPPTSTVRRQSSPHTSPRKGRRRHTSDVALRPFSPIKEDRSTEEAKSVKIAPAEEETQQKEADVTANKESTGKEMEHYFQQYSDELAKQAKEMKRVTIAQMESEGSTIESTSFSRLRTKNGSNLISTTPPSSSDSWMKSSNSCYLTTERKKQRKEKKSRKPRSWHPSPYVSEDEDEQMTREEKKAKIKAEIARRRQQIEENSRLHEELMKLAKSRENAEQMEYKSSYEYKSTPSISEHSTMYRTSHTSPSTRSTDSMLPGDTTSVLQAIDEILRKETQGVSSVRSSQYYNPAPPNVFSTMPRSRYTPRDTSWYQRESAPSTMQFPDTTAEDESIARIASTFPADSASKTGRLINKPKPLLELGTPPENDITPPMPLLPDMPSRSRKLLEDLGSSPIGGQPGRGEPVQPQYRQCNENERVPHIDVEPMPEPTMMRQMRNVQRQVIVRTPQKYEFPIKRILLTRDPKDRSVSGNGLGMKVVGGKEIPGGNGLLGAYVAKVCPGGVVETMGEVREGNQVLEWNGVPLTGRTYEEVQKIISVTADEVEIVIRSDFNMLEPISSCQGLSPARDGVSPCSTPSDSLKAGTPGARTPSPCSSLTTRRVSSPASTSSSISTPTYDNIAPSHLGNIDKVQAVSREHYRRNTVQTLPRFIGNHYGPPPQPTTIERRES